ncbi:hypothetical protein B0H65DRAFT_240281 [Neurospora tetraspora]|uniref:Uncharacterized protein n=1 Tax=Neurospora tetraspora TaxID=94610 RepID=A0AAE0JE49_9PEZI|nr:hypothetical protein B0H65DRAFT_240281 [Neurospora tetraspora]
MRPVSQAMYIYGYCVFVHLFRFSFAAATSLARRQQHTLLPSSCRFSLAVSLYMVSKNDVLCKSCGMCKGQSEWQAKQYPV